jgi:hypothetical protein
MAVAKPAPAGYRQTRAFRKSTMPPASVTLIVAFDPSGGGRTTISRHAGETPVNIIVTHETDARPIAENYTQGIAANLDRAAPSAAVQRSPFCLS